MNIQTIDKEPFTVNQCVLKTAKNGHDYLRLELENAHRDITGHCWLNSYRGPTNIHRHDIITVSGRVKALNYKSMIDIHQIEIVRKEKRYALEAFPGSTTKCHQNLLKLIDLTKEITIPPLSGFIHSVFFDRELLTRFLSLPASHKFHHAYTGGLATHSLECAEIVKSIPSIDATNRELAVVAALLHDAGKLITMQENKKNAVGYLVDHDSLTIEALVRPLSELDQTWPDAAMALRHIWTCRSIRQWGFKAKMPIAQLVQMADRISSESDLERQAFSNQEEWKQHAIHRESENRFWRIRPYKTKETDRIGVKHVQAY